MIEKKRIFQIIVLSIFVKLIFSIIFTTVPGFRLDMSDFSAYYTWTQWWLEGQHPYVDFHVDYPMGFWIPIAISTILSGWLANVDVFVSTFRIFMVACDAIVAVCVYLIALKLYDEKSAFNSTILYIFAFSTTHYVFWKFDAFPLMLLMVAITLAMYGKMVSSYFVAISGFFTKMFPIVCFPFIKMYNNNTRKKDQLLMAVIFLLVLMAIQYYVFGYESLSVFEKGAGNRDFIYATTLWYALSTIFGFTLSVVTLSKFLLVICGGIGLFVLYQFWKSDRNEFKLLGCIMVAVFLASLSNTHYSPQFSMWIAPFLSIMLVTTVGDILLFFIYQIIGYISYPVLFDRLYNNNRYLWDAGTLENQFVTVFFIVQWVFYIVVVIYIYRKTFRANMPSMSKN